MKHTLHFTGMALALGLALPAGAADQETGLYFNAEGGPNWATDLGVKGGPDAELNVGTRFGAGVGYNLTRNFGVEFDTGWLWNTFKDSDDSSLAHMPFMVNGVFRYALTAKIESYIGAGLGGTYSVLTIDEGPVDDDDGDVSFSWQAMAGVRYRFKENMSLGLGYKYLSTSDTEYEIEGAKVKFDNTHNHSFGVVFNMTF